MKRTTVGMVLCAGLLALGGCRHSANRGAGKAAKAQVARTPAPAKAAPAAPAKTPAVPPKTARAEAPRTPAVPPKPPPATPRTRPTDAPPAGPGSTVNRITIHPAHPKANEPIHVTAGPVMFRNTCEGIATVAVHRKGHTITIVWTRKKVPPHVMCGMMVHSDPVTATIPGLPAGRYTLVVTGIGRRPLSVGR